MGENPEIHLLQQSFLQKASLKALLFFSFAFLESISTPLPRWGYNLRKTSALHETFGGFFLLFLLLLQPYVGKTLPFIENIIR